MKRGPILQMWKSCLTPKSRHMVLKSVWIYKVQFQLLIPFFFGFCLCFQQQMNSDTHSLGPLLNMDRVRTILTQPYPYQLEHSQHAIIAVIFGWLFFISSDNLHTIIQKLDKNIKWWSMYICLFAFFYFFSTPFMRKPIKPNYSNFSRW
jgi:hypothetical protein